jgi:LPXTG-site transpeptidase (sortase) family protein
VEQAPQMRLPHDDVTSRAPGVGPPLSRPGCHSPLLLGLVLSLALGACCALGVTGGALIRELLGYDLSLGVWPSQRQAGSVATHGPTMTPEPDRRLEAPPLSSPVATQDGAGHSPVQPGRTPVALASSPTVESIQATAPPDAPEPTTVSPPVEQIMPESPKKGLPANQPTRPASRLVIPSLGVDAPVVLLKLEHGTWDIDQLTQEVGHLQGTAAPGDPSNVTLAGHVTLASGGDGPFKNLAQLRIGEDMLVYSSEQVYRYAVESVRVVAPEDVEVTYPTSQPILTLITCANWDRTRHVYDQRIVAVGHLVP